MGTVKKIGGQYYIEFEARGLKYQQKAGTDEQAAHRMLEDVETKIRQGEMGALVRDVDVDIFFADFLNDAKHHPPRTLARFTAAVRHFQSFLKDKAIEKLSQVTPRVIENYQAKIPAKPRTARFTMILLHDVLDYGIKLGYINDNPTRHVRLRDVQGPPPPRYLTAEEEARLLEEQDKCLTPIVEFVLATGLRMRDVVRLKWQDVSVKQGLLLSPRKIPLPARALSVLKEMKESGGCIFAGSEDPERAQQALAQELSSRLQRCGLKAEINFTTLTNTFIHRLLTSGIPFVKLYPILGFADIARLNRYAGYIPRKDHEEI